MNINLYKTHFSVFYENLVYAINFYPYIKVNSLFSSLQSKLRKILEFTAKKKLLLWNIHFYHHISFALFKGQHGAFTINYVLLQSINHKWPHAVWKGPSHIKMIDLERKIVPLCMPESHSTVLQGNISFLCANLQLRVSGCEEAQKITQSLEILMSNDVIYFLTLKVTMMSSAKYFCQTLCHFDLFFWYLLQ